MLSKSKKIIITVLLSILSVLIFVLGVWGIHYIWNKPINAKLEIAELLGISNVNSNTVEEDMSCSWQNEFISIKYRGEVVYHAYMMEDNKLVVYDLNNIEYRDYGTIYYHTKETTSTDKVILKCIEHVDDGRLRFTSALCIVVFSVMFIIIIGFAISEINKQKKLKSTWFTKALRDFLSVLLNYKY